MDGLGLLDRIDVLLFTFSQIDAIRLLLTECPIVFFRLVDYFFAF